MEFKALDAYSIKARYAPTMIVLAPLFLIAASFFPEQITSSKNLLVLIGSFLGITVVFDQVGRDYGKKRQTDLFREWGGTPSTVFLRHSESPPAERVASGSPPEGGIFVRKAPLGL